MIKHSLIPALAFCAGLVIATSAAAADSRQELTIPQIYEQLAGQGYWNIDRIEKEAGSYEVTANERNGDRVKLYLSARTGEVLERRLKGGHRERRAGDAMRKAAGRGLECNERRCRDDLPAVAPAAPGAGGSGAGKP